MTPRAGLLLGSLALAALVGLAFAPSSYDDSYITYRHADNFAHGRGFVFNPGEKLLGSSAPGYGLVLGGLARLLQPIGLEVDQLGAAASLITLTLLPLLLSRLIGPLHGLRPEVVAAAFAVLAVPARWNAELIGCEQLPILALVAGAFCLAVAEREVAAGACAGLATAFRFDAGLAIAALAVAIWIDRRRLPWRFALAASLPVLACWAWLLATFGSILPVTLAGKRSEMDLVAATYGASELAWLIRTLGPLGTIAVLALALGGLAGAVRCRGRARLFAIAGGSWLLAHELFYRIVEVPFAPWYQLPAFNALLALAACGVVRLVAGRGAAEGDRRRPPLRLVTAALAALGVGVLLQGTVGFYLDTWGRPPDARIRIYRDIAEDLRTRASPEARIAAVEIGALAYFSERTVVDLAGLLDSTLRDARREDRLSAAVTAASPDYLVDNPAFHGNFLKQLVDDGDLDRRFRAVATFTRPEYPHSLRLLVPVSAPSD